MERIAIWKDANDNVTVIAAGGDKAESELNFAGDDFQQWPWDLGVYSLSEEGIMVWEGLIPDEEEKQWEGFWRRPSEAELKELATNGSPW